MNVIRGWFVIEDGYIIIYATTGKDLAAIMEMNRYSDVIAEMSYGQQFTWDKMSARKKIERMIESQYMDATILENPTPDELSDAFVRQLAE